MLHRSIFAACLAALVLLPASAHSISQVSIPVRNVRPLPDSLPQEEFPEGWQAYDQGLARAKALRKFVMIQFFEPGCRPCQQMGADVTADPRLDDIIRRSYVLVRVNRASARKLRHRGRLLSESQLSSMHQVKAYPTLLFLGPDGRLLGRKIGYSSATELSQVLSYLSTGAYNTMAFNAFQKRQGETF